MSILQQGVLVVDTNWNETTDFCDTTPIPSKFDTAPSTLLFLNACVGVTWMIVSFFVFNKNNINIKAMNGTDTIPLLWFWDHLSNSFHGWTAAMYLATLLGHLLTSV